MASRLVQSPPLAADIAKSHHGVDKKNIAFDATNLEEDTSRVLIPTYVQPHPSLRGLEPAVNAFRTRNSASSAPPEHNCTFTITSGISLRTHSVMECGRHEAPRCFASVDKSTVGCPSQRPVWAAREFVVIVLTIPKDKLWARGKGHAQGHVVLVVVKLGHVVLVCRLGTAGPYLESICARTTRATTHQPGEGLHPCSRAAPTRASALSLSCRHRGS